MKLITSTDLQNWKNTRESQQKLPLLIRRLIINNIGFQNIQFIDIPGGDSIWKPGVDGKIIPKVENMLGTANKMYVIEFGQTDDAYSKFKEDFAKRTKELNNQKTETVFVFITTHKWRSKLEIIEKIKKEEPGSNLWSEIKTFDADDIETWLDHDFATTAWLSDILGKASNGIKSFDSELKQWKHSTKIAIDEDIILARQNLYSHEINQWLQSDKGILKIQSESKKESMLFLMASLLKSPFNQNTIDSIKSQIIIIENISSWQLITENHTQSKKLILISDFGIPDNLGILIDKGFKIFIPLSKEESVSSDKKTIYIEPINNSLLYPILESKIKSYEKANLIIQKLGHRGTLLHLQRLLKRDDAPLPLPKWASKDNWEILLLAALVGSWNENSQKDKEIVSIIFGKAYSEITRKLSLYINIEEAPIKKIGCKWYVLIPENIIECLGGYLTSDIFKRYLEKATDILSIVNPKYDKPIKERLYFSAFDFHTKQKKYYSEEIINGICQGFAIIANKEHIFDSDLNVAANIQSCVNNIFTNKDWKIWATLNNKFSLLAEAAPNTILEILENTIKNNPKIITEIYSQSSKQDGGVFDTECLYSGMLFAMETLAWFDNYFVRVIKILFGLQKLKTIDTKWGNSPIESLKEIFCPWVQNTAVTLENRKDCISNLLKNNIDREVMFSLLYGLLPIRYATSSPNSRPKFIEIPVLRQITEQEIYDFYQYTFQTILSVLSDDVSEWKRMIQYINQMDNVWFEQFIAKLDETDLTDKSDEFIKTIYQALEHYMHQEDYMSEDQKEEKQLKIRVERIREFYKKLNIINPIDKNIQLFSNNLALKYAQDNAPRPILQTAIQEIISSKGTQGIIDFAKQIEDPILLGIELGYAVLSMDQIKEILNTTEFTNDKVKLLTNRFFLILFHIKGINILDYVFDKSWTEEYKKNLICSINQNQAYWDWIEKNTLSTLYWTNIFGHISVKTDEEYEFAIRKLNENKNYFAMLNLIYMQKYDKNSERIKTQDIVTVLYGLLTLQKLRNISYEIETLFSILQKAEDIDEETLLRLELMYFPLFEYNENLKPITIYKNFRTNPAFTIEIIQMSFLRNKELENKSDDEKQNLENAHNTAVKLYVELKSTFPFNNAQELKQWIYRVISLLNSLEDKDLAKTGIGFVGEILGNSPIDEDDNIWPIRYVRDVIEDIYSDDVKHGVERGKFNSIGVYTVDAKNPGTNWSKRATKFREDAQKIRFQYPMTAIILDELAKNYEWHSNEERGRF